MPLQKEQLKAGIKTLLQDMMQREQASYDEFADRLSTLIETYVKSGTVTGNTVSACTAGGSTGTCTGIIN